MFDIVYKPENVGKEIINNRGKRSIIRKYHMTEEEKILTRERWLKEIKNIPMSKSEQAGTKFYNPYRRGIYYYQIYSMFLLGANEWHDLGDIVHKMEEIMSKIIINKDGINITAWDKFRGKVSRTTSIKCKDFIGRIQENMIFFQRLNKFHPTGYKLMQVCTAVDMKRTSKVDFPNGYYQYRLSTYDNIKEALPIRDFSQFNFPKNKYKYMNYKFIGTIVTRDKIITKGVLNEMS